MLTLEIVHTKDGVEDNCNDNALTGDTLTNWVDFAADITGQLGSEWTEITLNFREDFFGPDEFDIETVLAQDWRGDPTSLVVETSGSAEGFEQALAATRPRGTLVLKSTIRERPSVDPAPLVINEIRLVGSRCGPFPPALRALETGSVDVRPLVSERVALNEAVEGIRRAREPGALKVLIEP